MYSIREFSNLDSEEAMQMVLDALKRRPNNIKLSSRQKHRYFLSTIYEVEIKDIVENKTIKKYDVNDFESKEEAIEKFGVRIGEPVVPDFEVPYHTEIMERFECKSAIFDMEIMAVAIAVRDYALSIPLIAVKFISDVPQSGHNEWSYEDFAQSHSDFTPLLEKIEQCL